MGDWIRQFRTWLVIPFIGTIVLGLVGETFAQEALDGEENPGGRRERVIAQGNPCSSPLVIAFVTNGSSAPFRGVHNVGQCDVTLQCRDAVDVFVLGSRQIVLRRGQMLAGFACGTTAASIAVVPTPGPGIIRLSFVP